MSKHTPGPWHVDGHNLTSVIAEMQNGGWQHVCSCDYGYADPEKYFELNFNNARLIAAAPEMYELLCNIQGNLDPDSREYGDLRDRLSNLLNRIDNG